MKRQEAYAAWKTQRKQAEATGDFTGAVMSKIHEYNRSRRSFRSDIEGLIDSILLHPLAKVGLVAAGAIAGVVRVIFMLYAFLGA